jgi:hypothetical protein
MNTKRFGSFAKNPSVEGIEGVKLVPRSIKNKSQVVVDKKSGQMWEQFPVDTTTTLADTRTFIKVYQQSMVSLKDMTNAAIKLYCFILAKLRPNKDTIRISYKGCAEFCAFGNKMSYYNGLEQLLEQEFIFKTLEVNEYWINVNLLFNGNRLHLVDEEDIRYGKPEKEEDLTSKIDYISNFENNSNS